MNKIKYFKLFKWSCKRKEGNPFSWICEMINEKMFLLMCKNNSYIKYEYQDMDHNPRTAKCEYSTKYEFKDFSVMLYSGGYFSAVSQYRIEEKDYKPFETGGKIIHREKKINAES